MKIFQLNLLNSTSAEVYLTNCCMNLFVTYTILCYNIFYYLVVYCVSKIRLVLLIIQSKITKFLPKRRIAL